MSEWQNLKLWNLLLDRAKHADKCRSLLEQSMPTIETFAAKSGTALPDFTLHDADHGYRVAENMGALITDDLAPIHAAHRSCVLRISSARALGSPFELNRVSTQFQLSSVTILKSGCFLLYILEPIQLATATFAIRWPAPGLDDTRLS